MTKDTKEINELRIESEIGRNVADYIFNKAKEKCIDARIAPHDIRNNHGSSVLFLKDLQEICNQPPPIENGDLKRAIEHFDNYLEIFIESDDPYEGYALHCWRCIKEAIKPPIEKEMTAAELVEKLKKWCQENNKLRISAYEDGDREVVVTVDVKKLGEYAESLLKHNSEEK